MMIMNIIWMIVLGLIVGVIAKLIVPGTGHIGWIATALLGIAGGWVGGTLGSIVFAPHRLEITHRSSTRFGRARRRGHPFVGLPEHGEAGLGQHP